VKVRVVQTDEVIDVKGTDKNSKSGEHWIQVIPLAEDEKKDIYTWVDKMKGESDKNTQLRKRPSLKEAMAIFNRLASNEDKLEEEAWEGEQEKSDPPFYSVYSDEEIESMRKDVEEQMEDDYHYKHKFDEGKERYDLIPIECYEAIVGESDHFWSKEYVKSLCLYRITLSESFLGVKDVLEYGLRKYGKEGSWKHVPRARQRYFASSIRHSFDVAGFSLDKYHEDEESGLPSIYHRLCNHIFLLWFEIQESK